MKVIYETVDATIRKAIRDADEHCRKIARIDLAWWEANELSDCLRRTIFIKEDSNFTHYGPGDGGKVIGTYMGVTLQVESQRKLI